VGQRCVPFHLRYHIGRIERPQPVQRLRQKTDPRCQLVWADLGRSAQPARIRSLTNRPDIDPYNAFGIHTFYFTIVDDYTGERNRRPSKKLLLVHELIPAALQIGDSAHGMRVLPRSLTPAPFRSPLDAHIQLCKPSAISISIAFYRGSQNAPFALRLSTTRCVSED
jgi:hypothetical protein